MGTQSDCVPIFFIKKSGKKEVKGYNNRKTKKGDRTKLT